MQHIFLRNFFTLTQSKFSERIIDFIVKSDYNKNFSLSNNCLIQISIKMARVEDLSRMYRLYHKIPKGLDPVANVFKQVGFFRFCIMLCAYFESLVLVLFNAVL